MTSSAKEHSSPWPTLSVLAATLAVVVWLRHDALDTYWLQTRHSELGLSSFSDDGIWDGGVRFTGALNKELAAQQGQLDELGSRLTLASNIVLGGREILDHGHPPLAAQPAHGTNPQTVAGSVDLVKATGRQGAVALELNKAGLGGSIEQPFTLENLAKPELPPLNGDGQIVLTQQDKVLLVGDSMMQGVAPHVARALQKANIPSIDLSRQSTGLTYPNYFDWPATVQKTIPGAKVTVMVVFLGANDTWDMILGGRFERFGTEKWQSVYAARIDSMVKFAESQHVRVVWLGAPNMGREKINSGVKVLNQLYASQTNDGVARYVSTREVLGGNSDAYQKHITKDDGKTVTVRTDDGIHFTRDGQVMLSNLILRQFAIPAANVNKSS
jgi:lysophospholipase L1-like esterase